MNYLVWTLVSGMDFLLFISLFGYIISLCFGYSSLSKCFIAFSKSTIAVPMQDVAVKVLTVQDFNDDQLKEFLREVCTG